FVCRHCLYLYLCFFPTRRSSDLLWVHYMFDLMVMVGMYSLVVTFVYIICTLKKKWNPHKKWLLTLLVLNGPLAMLGIEFGWIYADRKSTRLNSSHVSISYAVFCW